MTAIWEILAGSVVMGWTLSQLPIMRRWVGISYAIGAVLIGGTAILGLQFGGIFIATLLPFGVMLPVLCLTSTLRQLNAATLPDIPAWDKLGWAGAMIFVILGSLGAIKLFPYGWFYSGLGPLIIAVLVGLWAVLRRQAHILIAVLVAQVFWLTGIGSSNFYDQITHFILVPALVISAVRQGIRNFRQ